MSSTSDTPASEAVIDGILTRYTVAGSGPPLLMFSPGGFNATMSNWETHGIYQRTAMLARLRERFTCITFDKRESGGSGGRVERVRWLDYAYQGIGLLDHLGYQRAYVMGACVGCSIATVMATVAPDRRDREFTARYVDLDPARYQVIVAGMCRLLFDRDTVPGAEPEDLLTLYVPALIVPGNDSSHAPSAAHTYGSVCLRPTSGTRPWPPRRPKPHPPGSSTSCSHCPLDTCRAVRPMCVRMTAVAFSRSRFLMALTNWRCSRLPRIPISGWPSWTCCSELRVGP
jgi:hypothetical protein